MKRLTLLTAVALSSAYAVISPALLPCGPCILSISSAHFKIFRLLSAVVATLAVVIGIWLWKWTADLWKEGNRAGTFLAGVEMALGAGFGAWLFNSTSIYVFGPKWEAELPQVVVGVLIFICFVMVALPSAAWMNMSRLAFLRIGANVNQPRNAADEFHRLKEQAEVIGMLCAFGIAASTLPLGAWRRVVVAADKDLATFFPTEYVILFGLYWSFFLAAGYVPLYVASARAGLAIRDALVPPLPLTSDTFSDWQKKRQEVDAYLGIGASAFDTFKLALAILAPLLGGILSTLTTGG